MLITARGAGRIRHAQSTVQVVLPSVPWLKRGESPRAEPILLSVVINQPIADFAIIRHRRARTHLFNPSRADLIGKPSKAKYRDGKDPAFSRQRLHEIT